LGKQKKVTRRQGENTAKNNQTDWTSADELNKKIETDQTKYEFPRRPWELELVTEMLERLNLY
jgi:hypothetical protein